MYELARVLLRAVGPEAARYEDVLLDFSGAGATVSAQPTLLFGEEERVQRPSPASVLHLENGGGKSVLIKLIFSVILPGRREVVGTTSTHALDSFVLENDVSHVVLEWVHAKSGRHLVTGKVSAWRNGRPSRDRQQLVERWYHFRPTETAGLRNLPFVSEGRYRPLPEFCDAMLATAEADPAMEYACLRVHRQWTDRLTDLGLDPELFRYQRAMNADEGEAADVFSFASDSAFVNFLLGVVLPTEPPTDLADVLNAYADKLSVRGDLELEKDFVQGALKALDPLAQARQIGLAAIARRDEAHERLDEILRLIRIRSIRENERADRHQTESQQLRDDLRREEDRYQHIIEIITELRRLVARMRFDEALAEEEHHRRQFRRAQLVEKAWGVVPTVLRHQDAVTEELRLSKVIAATHEAARPALEARDSAAGALRRSLIQLRDRARQEATDAETAGSAQDIEAGLAQAEHNAAIAQAAVHSADAGVHKSNIEGVRQAIETAVREGLAPDGMRVREAADTTRKRAEEAAARIDELDAALTRLDTEHDLAQGACRRAQQALATSSESHSLAERDYREARARTDALTADPGFAGLIGTDPVDLEADFTALLSRLADARQDAESAVATLQVKIADDERARTALETTELLPPSVEAVQVCQALEKAGIKAWTGWEYVAAISSVDRRRQIVHQVPSLVTGIVVNEAERFDAACEVLTASQLWPTEHLALGTKKHLLSAPPERENAEYVVPVHPALYDERAAVDELARLNHRHSLHARELASLQQRLNLYITLSARLSDWRREFPPGRLDALLGEVNQKSTELAAARELVVAQDAVRERLASERLTVKDAIPPERDTHRKLERAADALAELATREARIPSWLEAERTAQDAAAKQRETAQNAAVRSEQCRSQAAEHRRAADALKGTAQRLIDELAQLPATDAVPDHDAVPGQPLEILRRAYVSASDEYQRVKVGDDLQAKATLARDRVDAAENEIKDIDELVRQRAVELLDGPDAADHASRALAREMAERAVVAMEDRLAELTAVTTARKADAHAFVEPEEDIDLAPYARPGHLGEGLKSIAEAEQSREMTDRIRQELRFHSERADREATEAKRQADIFRDLTDVLGPGSGPEPHPDDKGFEGDITAARHRHDSLKSVYAETSKAADTAQRDERKHADRLAGHAADSRFAALNLPSRSIILSTERAELPIMAEQWEKALRQRLRSLDVDLDSIDRHRRQIVRQMKQQVEEALRTLQRAERFSRLPEGLADWSGEPFLRIGFTAAKDDALTDRLAAVVDEASADVVAGRAIKRDGMSLLLRGVASAVGSKGFRVRILKPDAVLRKHRVPVSELKDVFSGGQVLTAAIILYCTMAALRSNERGRTGRRHSGVLFLDNPIGRASATYLLRLQQAVAAALGVQLIYTTGIFDLTVLDNFPLVIRMRNDADLRTHRKYLRVQGEMETLLDGSLPGGRNSEISTARYYRRHTENDDED
ncbi:hypothetical protein ACFFS2_31910 [Streptomyces aurantiacus]|uniref:Uncharacterized protein n=1 Tax=Streptomyces aurantiacus TaxID=47760 RepID=A0A7G1P113_9ACTN|nr:hypothetical protein [Streptomyces aurantiacus]BCL27564.1 hypothetical protein GCM10017557_24230 [Streptomyces aurantiacus]